MYLSYFFREKQTKNLNCGVLSGLLVKSKIIILPCTNCTHVPYTARSILESNTYVEGSTHTHMYMLSTSIDRR